MQATERIEELTFFPKGKLKIAKEAERVSGISSKFAILIFVFAFLVIFNVVQRAIITQSVFELESLKMALEQENLRQEKLKIAINTLKSPERIEKVALEKLGMVYPTQVSYIILPEELTKEEPYFKLVPSRRAQGSKIRFSFSSLTLPFVKSFNKAVTVFSYISFPRSSN